jgi:hypothetical protein
MAKRGPSSRTDCRNRGGKGEFHGMGTTDPQKIANAINIVAGMAGLDEAEQIRYVDDLKFREAVLRVAHAQFDIDDLREQNPALKMRRSSREPALAVLDRLTIDPTLASAIKVVLSQKSSRPGSLDDEV